MAKATLLKDLTHAYYAQHNAIWTECHAPYKNMPKNRWAEVCNAHNRAVRRKLRRSAGKSNKGGARRTAFGMVCELNHRDAMTVICSRNRKIFAAEAGAHD